MLEWLSQINGGAAEVQLESVAVRIPPASVLVAFADAREDPQKKDSGSVGRWYKVK